MSKMTREEAIEFIVQLVKSNIDIALVADAIEALSQEPTEICCATCKHERLDDINYKCEFQNECLVEGKRGKYEFAYAKYEPIVEQQPCDDAISREAVMNTEYQVKIINDIEYVMLSEVQMKIRKMPPVTQKSETITEFADRCRECGARYGKLLKQKSGKCKNCKYFEYDSVAKVDGIPLIVAHEICNM